MGKTQAVVGFKKNHARQKIMWLTRPKVYLQKKNLAKKTKETKSGAVIARGVWTLSRDNPCKAKKDTSNNHVCHRKKNMVWLGARALAGWGTLFHSVTKGKSRELWHL